MRCVVEYSVRDGGDIMSMASEAILAHRYQGVLSPILLSSGERNSTYQRYTNPWITANRKGSQ
jgi:hypothetical protein